MFLRVLARLEAQRAWLWIRRSAPRVRAVKRRCENTAGHPFACGLRRWSFFLDMASRWSATSPIPLSPSRSVCAREEMLACARAGLEPAASSGRRSTSNLTATRRDHRSERWARPATYNSRARSPRFAPKPAGGRLRRLHAATRMTSNWRRLNKPPFRPQQATPTAELAAARPHFGRTCASHDLKLSMQWGPVIRRHL